MPHACHSLTPHVQTPPFVHPAQVYSSVNVLSVPVPGLSKHWDDRGTVAGDTVIT